MTKTAAMASASSRAMFHALPASSMMIRGPQVADAPDEGALSMAQAAEALRSAREPQSETAATQEPEAPVGAAGEAPEAAEEPVRVEAEPLPAESEAEPTAEESPDPETAIEGEEEIAEPERDPEAPAIAAPQSWDAHERATFATLPPAVQEIILNRETERDRAVSRAQQEANEAKKTAETNLQAGLADLAQYKTAFDEIATRANQVFADKWANVDWIELAKSDHAAYNVLKATYDVEAAELTKVKQAQAEADRVKQQAAQVQFQNYLASQVAVLPDLAPHLAGEAGAGKRAEVGTFLRGLKMPNGERAIPDQSIANISAMELALAHDAMEYRKLKAQGKAAAVAKPVAPAPRPNPAPARAAAPSAAPPTRPTQQRNVEAAKNRFAQTGSTDDAIALLRASRGAT
jgi:hypothetical protein